MTFRMQALLRKMHTIIEALDDITSASTNPEILACWDALSNYLSNKILRRRT